MGIELDEADGKNDGSVNGISYFSCRPNHGVFAPPNRVRRAARSVSRTGSIGRTGSVGRASSTESLNSVEGGGGGEGGDSARNAGGKNNWGRRSLGVGGVGAGGTY